MTKEEQLYVQNLKTNKAALKKELNLLYDEYDKLSKEGRPNSELNVIARAINSKWADINTIDIELDRIYKMETQSNNTDMVIVPQEEELPEVIHEDEVKEEPVEDKDEKKAFWSRVGIAALATAVLGTGAYLLGNSNNCSCSGKTISCVNDRVIEQPVDETKTSTPTVTPDVTEAPVEEVKPFESYGNFTDASDPEALEARTDYYFNNYFNKYYDANTLEKGISKEELIDIMSVFNGKLPVEGEFNVNELMNYTNKAKQALVFYASTEKDEENNTRKFIPMAPLFEDGSYEQKCALEVDEIMEPLIKAMNEGNNEDFVKYATMFGELMRDQYYLVDSTTEHYGVRSKASYAARPHLWKLSYAQYVGNIFEYGVKNDIDVCIPFCYKYGTDEIEMIPLSKLMATLEFVPMGQWDAVLQRAGLTPEQIKELGNASVEDTMSVVFTRDAKNHFRELQNQKTLKNN